MTDLEKLLEPIPEWMFGTSVESRNALQNCGRFHPYTCGGNRMDDAHRKYEAEHGGDFGQMVAVEEPDGTRWRCPVCGYTQK